MCGCDGVLSEDDLPGESSDGHQRRAAVCGKGIGDEDGFEAEAFPAGKASNFGLLRIVEIPRMRFNWTCTDTRKLPAIGCGNCGVGERLKQIGDRDGAGQNGVLSYVGEDVSFGQQLCRQLPSGAVIKL